MKLNRRSFLRGAGTAGLALPFLESLPERSAFAQDDSKPTFGLFVVTSCGVVGRRFWPAATGALTADGMAADPDKSISVLAEHADRLLMVRGVNCPNPPSGCGHAAGLSMALTAAGMTGSSNNIVPTGISADTAIAEGLGVSPLTLYAGLKGGYIDEKLSFSAPQTVRAAEGNPYNVYLDLAGLLDSSGEPTVAADQLAASRKSINDLVGEDLRSLMTSSRISASDKQRLQLHLDSIRDIENSMMDLANSGGLVCSGAQLDMDALEEIKTTFRDNGRQEDVVKLQLELAALAFSCNVTRVGTLQAGDGTDATQYTIGGEKYERFHHISHRINSDGVGGSPIDNAEEKHYQIDRLRLESLKYGLDKWAQYDTPNGPLLDNGFIYWSSHISDGPSHSVNNLPVIIAGSAGGYLKQGQYVDSGGTSNSRVFNTLITANGVPTENFGTGGTGLLNQMLANGSGLVRGCRDLPAASMLPHGQLPMSPLS